MAYPTSNARRTVGPAPRPGFQPAGRDIPPYRPIGPVRLPWPPANDVAPRPPGVLPGPRAPTVKRPLGALGRYAGRFLPWLGWGLVAYDLYRWYQNRVAGWPSPEGWVKDFECSKPLNYCQKWRSVTGGWNWCLTLQAAGANCDDYINPSYNVMLRLHRTSSSISWRWNVEARWHRVVAGSPWDPSIVKLDAAVRPVSVPTQSSSWLPSLNAMTLPLAAPAPTPRPIPYRVLPYVQPHPDQIDQSERVYPRLAVQPRASDYVLSPAGGVSSRPASGHVFRRPPRGTKERKLKLYLSGVPARVIGVATEAMELVDPAYYALPKSLRWEYRKQFWVSGRVLSRYERARIVYRHWDQVDFDKFMTEVVKNQAADYAAGAGSRKVRKANRIKYKWTGTSGGLELGPAM